MNTQDKYWQPLQVRLAKVGDPLHAEAAAKYMRNLFSYYGLYTKDFRSELKAFYQKNGLPAFPDMVAVIKASYKPKERELQYAGIDLLYKLKKNLQAEHIHLVGWMITNKSWWDSVDGLHKINAYLFEKFPVVADVIEQWSVDENMWLRRAAICFQLSRKQKTDLDLLFKYCLLNADSKEFFIQKAIGWSLREYCRVDPRPIIRFVQNEKLPALSVREALKHYPDERAAMKNG